MARITYGPLVTGIAGKVGGLVFRGNGGSGVVQSKGVVSRSGSTAQQAHREFIGECRGAYQALEENDRLSFDFSVNEGYEMRRETGGKFRSGLQAYTSWFLVQRYCGQTTGAPTSSWAARTCGRAPMTEWGATADGGTPHLRLFYASSAGPHFAVWVCHAKNAQRVPGRPAWSLVYAGDRDTPVTWVATGEIGARAWAADFGPYLAGRVSGFTVGSFWAVRFYYAPGQWIAARGPATVLTVGAE